MVEGYVACLKIIITKFKVKLTMVQVLKFFESVKFNVECQSSHIQGRIFSRIQLASPYLILLEYDLDPEERIGSTLAVTIDGT